MVKVQPGPSQEVICDEKEGVSDVSLNSDHHMDTRNAAMRLSVDDWILCRPR